MSKTYVVALDQGTTSSRAMLIDREGRVADVVQNPFPQIFPKPAGSSTIRAISSRRSSGH